MKSFYCWSSLNHFSDREVCLSGLAKHEDSQEPAHNEDVEEDQDDAIEKAWLAVTVDSNVLHVSWYVLILTEVIMHVPIVVIDKLRLLLSFSPGSNSAVANVVINM